MSVDRGEPRSAVFSTTVDDAYRTCEQITRSAAKNFYYGIRLLTPDRRAALCAVYALARRIDDIGDGDLPADSRRALLTLLRDDLRHIDHATDPVLVAVAHAAHRYPIPLDAFGELVDGVQMDLDLTEYQDFDELVVYCRRVAGSIGRLCLSVFGPARPAESAPTAEYADQLGIALQQTNILRDVREDLMNGRVYLPREELERFGVRLGLDTRGRLADPDGGLAALVRSMAARAQEWYALGLRLVPYLDRRSAACTLAMTGIYRDLLGQISQDPTRVYAARMSLSPMRKARLAAISLARAGWA